MNTSRFFNTYRQWIIVLLIGCGLFITAIAYPKFGLHSIDLHDAQPAIADPMLGSGGGPG